MNPYQRIHFQFLDFVHRNPECLSRDSFRSLKRHQEFIPYPLQPWPVLLPAYEASDLARTALEITKLVSQIPKRFFHNDARQLARFYRLSLRQATGLAMVIQGVDCFSDALMRMDLMLSPSGFQCLEINASNLGGWMSAVWAQEYLDQPLIQQFLQEEELEATYRDTARIMLKHALRCAQRRLREDDGESNVAIVLPEHQVAPESWQRFAREQYTAVLAEEGATGELWTCHYSELSENGLRVYHGGRRVHAILEQCWGFAPLPVIFSWIDRSVMVFNGPTCRLLQDKRNLALLSEACDSALLNAEESALVETHVPWTRILAPRKVRHEGREVDLEALLIERQGDFVIKPAGGAEGVGVHVGSFMPEPQWRHAVKRGLRDEGWLAQRFVESIPAVYQTGDHGSQPHDLIWGAFVCGDDYGGCFMRLAPLGHSGVINSARGAEEGVLLEVSSIPAKRTYAR